MKQHTNQAQDSEMLEELVDKVLDVIDRKVIPLEQKIAQLERQLAQKDALIARQALTIEHLVIGSTQTPAQQGPTTRPKPTGQQRGNAARTVAPLTQPAQEIPAGAVFTDEEPSQQPKADCTL